MADAIDCCRALLNLRTRERVPLDWAMTQNNLGCALTALGEREFRPTRLEKAVSAFLHALKEFKRERAPLKFAATKNNLGNALRILGEWEPGTARLHEAVGAYRDALEEWTRERVPRGWAMAQNSLGIALLRLGERTGDRGKLAEARKAIEAAFDVSVQAGQEQDRGYFEDRLQEIDRQIAALAPAP